MIDTLLKENPEKITKNQMIKEKDIEKLCLMAKDILREEGNLRNLSAPITVCGDIHGQFFDLRKLLQLGGSPKNNNYIFLGDFVDRGYHGLECYLLLLCYKVCYPDRVTLLRGNHESRQITQNYGFYEECLLKYEGGANIWRYITDTFDYLNIAALINGQIFCVHGGLSPKIQTLDQIRLLDRKVEPYDGPLSDMLWSDPEEGSERWRVSSRGAGYLFNSEVVKEFNQQNHLDLICRSHQLVEEGYKFMFNEKIVTVWSAPNYVYRCGNKASILCFDDNLKRNIIPFKESDEVSRPAERPLPEYFL